MLFLITQTHTPEACPIDAGGHEVLHEKPENVPGLKIQAAYGAFAVAEQFHMRLDIPEFDGSVPTT